MTPIAPPSRTTLLRVVGVPIRVFVRRLRALFAHNENALFFTAICLVGLLGGVAGATFRWLFDLMIQVFWGAPGELVFVAAAAGELRRLLVPTAGGLAAAILALAFVRRREERAGFPEVLEAISLGGRTIRLTRALGSAASSLMTLASGGAVGREGPMGQIAAAIGSRVGRSFRFSEERVRILVAAGIAAGFAAAYNTPIGATLFVLEVILGTFNVVFFGPAVIAAAISTIVTRAFHGPGPIYPPGAVYGMVSVVEVLPYLGLGFVAGLVAVGFHAVLDRMYRLWGRIPWSPLVVTPLGGLVVGALAVGLPAVLGNGYEPINLVLAGELAVGLMAVLFIAKMVATSVTLASGGSGGLFTATMFLGAMVGGVFGAGMHQLLPSETGTAGAYALAGMAGLVAGTTHAPFLAIIMIFELTQNYAIVLPLMLTSIAAYWTSRRIGETSIYEEELRRRGMRWEGTPQERLMRSLVVRDIMLTDVEPIEATLELDRVVEIFQASRALQLYVVEEDRRFAGIVELHSVKQVIGDRGPGGLVIAADLVHEIPVVEPDTSLVEVNEKLWFRDLGQLPVVDEEARFLGIVTRRDVLGAFDREVLRRNALLAKVRATEGPGFDYVELPEEAEIVKLPAAPELVGRTLSEARLGDRGLTVIAIQRLDADGRETRLAPRAGTTIERGDVLVVMGEKAEIERLRR